MNTEANITKKCELELGNKTEEKLMIPLCFETYVNSSEYLIK